MSEFQEPPQDAYVSPEPVQKKGMSTGAKVLLILAVVFFVIILLCCGGGIFATFMARDYMEDAVTQDPAVVAQRKTEMLDIEVPTSFQPDMSLDIKVPMTDKRFMTIVGYRGPSPQESLVLVGLGDMFTGMSQEQMEQEIENSLEQQGFGQPEPGAEWATETKEFTIDGKTRKFVYRTEKNQEGEPVRYHVTGTVTGKRGPVFLVITARAETLSEEEIDQVIQSIE